MAAQTSVLPSILA